MRAEHLVGPLVFELAEQVKVEVADRGQEAVRIVSRRRGAARKKHLEPVSEQLAASLQPNLEDSRRMHARHRAPALLVVDEQRDALGVGPKHSHHDTVGLHVRAENGMRIEMFERDQALEAVRRILAVCRRDIRLHDEMRFLFRFRFLDRSAENLADAL